MQDNSPRWRLVRGVILFFSGLAGVGWETLHGPVNIQLLVLFATMMGLELFIRKDGR